MLSKSPTDGKSLYRAVHDLLPAKGMKQSDLLIAFGKKYNYWKTSSVGPALSFLDRAGLIRRERKHRLDPNKRVMPIRAYTDKDDARISAMMGRRDGSRSRAKAKSNGAMPFTSTKFMVAVGQKDTVVLDGKQAYALWKELNAIFGERA